MIYVTLGTMFLGFPRLVRKMDEIALATGEHIVLQAGLCKTLPAHCEWFDFKPREEVLALQEKARVIVCHAGIGSVIDALRARRPLIVVPRLKEFNEHLSDHQLDIAQAVERRGWGRMIRNMDELPDACVHPPEPPRTYQPAKHRLVAAVAEAVERVAAMRAGAC